MTGKIAKQHWVDIIPPFRRINGRKYDYPKTEAEWVRECKKAIAYRRKRFEAISSGGKIPIPPPNYYYSSLLVLPTQMKKREKRLEHRAILEKKGLIKKGQHVHHVDGVYDLKHAKVMDDDNHYETHAKRRKACREQSKDGSCNSKRTIAALIHANQSWD
jgi:hypothetical protein